VDHTEVQATLQALKKDTGAASEASS
jgi:hypothetical protein